MALRSYPSAASVNAIVAPQYVKHPDAASVNAIVSPQYVSFPAGGAVALDEPDVIFGANLLAWWNADAANITKGAGDIVSSVTDLSGNGRTLTEATGLLGPVWIDNSINGQDVLRFDGIASRLSNAALDIAAPGTGPTIYWMVLKQISYLSGDDIVSGGTASRAAIRQSGTTPALIMCCVTTANSNTDAPLASAARVIAKFNGSTGDYLKCRGTNVTGTSAGVTNPVAGFFVGCRPGATNFGNFDLAELGVVNLDIAHDSAQIVALDAYLVDKYGAVT